MVTPEPADAEIVLIVESDNLRARLHSALAECGHVRDINALGAHDPIDVLVTDAASQTPDELLTRRRQPQPSLGVVQIGQGTGDVVLPEDFSDRELVTACRLLTELVRLRRGRQDAIQSRSAYRRLAFTDALTGLANRRAWDQELHDRLASDGASPRRGLCLALVDLDQFAKVNADHGHASGDDVLKVTATTLQSSVRADDFVARLGGDEFGVVADIATPSDAQQLCVRLRQDIAAILAERAVCPVTASVGGTWSDVRNAASQDELYAKTSGALRQAKEAGRNRTVMH